MKTIKFFSFALIVALAWVSCKNTGAETTTETAGITADSLTALKAGAVENMNTFVTFLSSKITETEAAIAAAADDVTSRDLTAKLDGYKANLAAVQGVVAKINDATAETWATVATEMETVHGEVKMALSGAAAPSTTTVGGTGTENK